MITNCIITRVFPSVFYFRESKYRLDRWDNPVEIGSTAHTALGTISVSFVQVKSLRSDYGLPLCEDTMISYDDHVYVRIGNYLRSPWSSTRFGC
jgi:hypothetical protein